MPTGWRPADVEARYPIDYYREAHEQEKYDSHPSRALQLWSWLQLLINFAFMYHLMFSIAELSLGQILLYGGFIMLSVFASTTLLDRLRIALLFEGLKMCYATVWLYLESGSLFTGQWWWFVCVYLLASLMVTAYFVWQEGQSTKWTFKEAI